MEIRSALQKIENYLTVVSNLNRTILSEGTMSRDELLLMKKYLYTSIDRIEDIERSLIIDKKEDKSFTPTEIAENKFVPIPAKEKEIVAVAETDHIEEVESTMSNVQKEELEDMVENIQAELLPTKTETVAETTTQITEQITEEPVIEKLVTFENIEVNNIENINVVETNNIVTNSDIEPIINNVTEEPIQNTTVEKQNIIVEDTIESKVQETLVESVVAVENSIIENTTENTTVVEVNSIAETKTEIKEQVTETNLMKEVIAEIENVSETISAKFEENKPSTFVDELAKNKKEELSFLEKFEQKLNATSHPQLFQIFDDGKEELHESFANNKSMLEPVNTNFEKISVATTTATAYETNDTVLVEEKEVETIVEQLTPSSLNDVFKPQTIVENIATKSSKTLSESIALNDKFIFVRELFGNQFSEYENALKHLDTFTNLTDVEQYCNNTLWNKFNWTERASAAGRFMDLISKKYK